MLSYQKAFVVATLTLTLGFACEDDDPLNWDEHKLAQVLGDPLVGIKIHRDKTGYVFRFENCTKKHSPVGLGEIRVLRDVPREKIDTEPPVCLVTHHSGADFWGPTWRYGEAPPGYRIEHCEPLRSGITYRIDLLDKGFMRFTLSQNGDVSSTEPQCR